MMNYRVILPIIAFVSGFSLMVFELAAARVLAPTIGSSTYVWTSVIGVIIAALSFGYWAGGRVADARAKQIDLVVLLFICAGLMTFVMYFHVPFLSWMVELDLDVRLKGVFASLVLFAPTSFVIGMLSPYLVKLRVTSLATSGQSVASLSALESIGGIAGTFITGFVLFGFIGARETFAVVVVLLLIASWLLQPRTRLRRRVITTACILLFSVASFVAGSPGQIDTPSAHYSIVQGIKNNQPVRGITSGPNGIQSGVYPNQPDELVFWYTQQLADVVAAAPQKQRILVLGGGTFTLPRHLAETYPASQIDVVEIDPELATIARQLFYYDDPTNVQLLFTDARTYVNQTEQQYDIIIVDVYSDASVPFSLITKEYGQRLSEILSPQGVIGVNIIAGTEGACGQLAASLDAPYRLTGREAQYKMQYPNIPASNMIVTYAPNLLSWAGAQPYVPVSSPLYTDNFAPIERLQQACLNMRP